MPRRRNRTGRAKRKMPQSSIARPIVALRFAEQANRYHRQLFSIRQRGNFIMDDLRFIEPVSKEDRFDPWRRLR